MMKKIFHTLSLALLSAGAVLTTSCVGDLDQLPHIEQTSSTVYTSVDNYKAVLGKLYVSFTIAGQEKGGGKQTSLPIRVGTICVTTLTCKSAARTRSSTLGWPVTT